MEDHHGCDSYVILLQPFFGFFKTNHTPFLSVFSLYLVHMVLWLSALFYWHFVIVALEYSIFALSYASSNVLS